MGSGVLNAILLMEKIRKAQLELDDQLLNYKQNTKFLGVF